ncbi:metabolite traffic protein EboE [Deinococcus sp. QL22]|uniref:metabolite traffic protein EboE n=1 Tax=Deinococcus sp. QL22 TaxID=2939437 RepID=UPI002016B767|nr:metabolite traffic protein EboE [Deinococcus sp. QL22]UQN08647.1 metabolite traffic protein EboE [Deinococcus sp. QL22]
MVIPGRTLQLTYCTNIHPSNTLREVMENLDRYAVPLRAQLSPQQPFGIGLRLSGNESRELAEPHRLRAFREFLDQRGLYVFTMNGFPYGPFHHQAVKAQVHAPDWLDPERVAYTLRLIDILSALLPEGLDGGISTSPLTYRAWVNEQDAGLWTQLTLHVTEVVAALVRLRERTGQLIHLDIEPEPDGLLERSEQLAAFFTDHLMTAGASHLAAELGLTLAQAKAAFQDHLQVCFDTCHLAVAYESPRTALECYQRAGMRIGKVQLSSALRLMLPSSPQERRHALALLRPFVDSTYLHQVIARGVDGQLQQFPDLPEALSALEDPTFTEARIHFHVPVFLDEFAQSTLGSTQAEIIETLQVLREQSFTTHLEIETYTWDVLPPALKRPLLDMVEREFRWVQDVL